MKDIVKDCIGGLLTNIFIVDDGVTIAKINSEHISSVHEGVTTVLKKELPEEALSLEAINILLQDYLESLKKQKLDL